MAQEVLGGQMKKPPAYKITWIDGQIVAYLKRDRKRAGQSSKRRSRASIYT